MRSLRPFLRDLWALTRPYWVSEDRWPGRILLATLVAISLFLVYLNVRLNEWNGAFFNSLQEKDAAALWRLLWEWNCPTSATMAISHSGSCRKHSSLGERLTYRTVYCCINNTANTIKRVARNFALGISVSFHFLRTF